LTRFVSLSEILWLSEQVTGIDADDLARSSRLNLADSALHAPQASFGGQDFYPDLIDKAAVLACHLAWNHPLVDGNKRSSWASLVMFLDLNDVVWTRTPLTSMKRNRQCSPSRRTKWTKRGSPRGSENGRAPSEGDSATAIGDTLVDGLTREGDTSPH
jgi:death-on-curing protein